MSVNGNLSFNFSVTEVISSGVVTPINFPAAFAQNINYSTGTGSSQIDIIHAKQYSLVASPTTIDLTSLLSLSGISINFARVRELIVIPQDTTATHVITVGGGTTNPWLPVGAGLIVPAATAAGQAPLRISDPYSVGGSVGNIVGGSSKTIKFDPGAFTAVVNVYIFGCSAAS